MQLLKIYQDVECPMSKRLTDIRTCYVCKHLTQKMDYFVNCNYPLTFSITPDGEDDPEIKYCHLGYKKKDEPELGFC